MSAYKNSQKNLGKSVLKAIVLQLRQYFISKVSYDHSTEGGSQTPALARIFTATLVYPHWFNHTAQPGLDTSELKTCSPCYTCLHTCAEADTLPQTEKKVRIPVDIIAATSEASGSPTRW